MEEVDRIIIHSLRSVGCDIEEDVHSLRQFSTELIVSAAVHCIRFISPDADLPTTLPPGMSARFRMGASLANYIQEMGYKGSDLGYQTFLYSNESDIRKIFMFLVEKLPKDTSQTADEPLGSSVLLHRAVSSEIDAQLGLPWLPTYLKQQGIRIRSKLPGWHREGSQSMRFFHSCHMSLPSNVANLAVKLPKEQRRYYSEYLPYLTNQLPRHVDTGPSVLEATALEVATQQEWDNEWNSSGLASRLSQKDYKARKRERIRKMLSDRLQQDGKQREGENVLEAVRDLQHAMSIVGQNARPAAKMKGSRFAHTEKLLYSKDDEKTLAQIGGAAVSKDTEEETQRKWEEEATGLREELSQLMSQLEHLDVSMRKMAASKQQMEEVIALEGQQTQEREEALQVKKRTLDLLPDAQNNIAKLQAVVESSAQRLLNLATQWEKHRAPLIDQYRKLRQLSSQRESEAQKQLEAIKIFRAKMKEVADEARQKDDLYKQLQSEYERMTKDVNRSAYTRKIMEIVANIKKQKQEIDKILIDTKSVQKEINSLSGKLDRTFAVTDELIFRDAKKDEGVKKAYRFLAALHENCEQLTKTVEDTGAILREIRDLEDQIETESHKKVLANLEKITEDYQQMKKENSALAAKLKQK
ncbi:coiled-coil domain-containing protein 22 homolog [Pomacea canaliculata]|uniref:coiled-coil domain-containing protein 22 homolog n=1 Tax=Pomacea canaliculata TaxID=400727 RepID=UPI000D7335A3|nr:coiled-coil domain-containing protein 22 homolog [Pomacea canaliculata]